MHPDRVRRPGVRGHDDRRPRHRRAARHPLPARRVHLPAAAPRTRSSQRRRERRPAGHGHPAASRASTSTSTSTWAPAPTSAARRPHSSSRSRATAASRATARRSRSTPASSASPTVVNNVETFAWVGCILAKGADWFKAHRHRQVDRLQAVQRLGDCEKPGVYEFPLGITVAELLEEVGGEDAKAVQIGGASAVRPAVGVRPHPRLRGRLHRRLGHRLRPRRDMLDVAENFMEFFVDEIVRPVHAVPGGQRQAARRRRDARAGQLLDRATSRNCARWARRCSSPPSAGSARSSPNAFLSIVSISGRDHGPHPWRTSTHERRS